MSNVIINREEFDKIENMDVKLGILFDTNMQTLRLLKGKKLDAKAIAGGFMGGFVALIMKMAIWK